MARLSIPFRKNISFRYLLRTSCTRLGGRVQSTCAHRTSATFHSSPRTRKSPSSNTGRSSMIFHSHTIVEQTTGRRREVPDGRAADKDARSCQFVRTSRRTSERGRSDSRPDTFACRRSKCNPWALRVSGTGKRRISTRPTQSSNC